MASAVASLSSPPAMGVQWSNDVCVCVCVCVCVRARVDVCACVQVAFEGVCGPGVCTPFGIAAISSVQLNSGCCLREGKTTLQCTPGDVHEHINVQFRMPRPVS